MKDTIWKCRDGKLVLIRQMSDGHLHSAIRLILRSSGWRREFLERLLLEVDIRNLERK